MTEIEKQLLIENNELRFRLIENKIMFQVLQNEETNSKIVSRGNCNGNSLISTKDDPYRIIIGEMKEGACIISKDDTILYCNQLFADLFSWKLEEIIGLGFPMIVGKMEKGILELLDSARQKEKNGQVITLVTSPGLLRYFFMTVSSLYSDKSGDLFIVFTDVTDIMENRVTNEVLLNNARLAALNIMEDEIAAKNELEKANSNLLDEIFERRKAEVELIKVNRLYTVISLINQMIVRNQVRETIFTEACNIVIEHGKFQMAWIGLLDEKKDSIIPVTWAGAEMGYLTTIKKISTKNISEGNGPTGKAVREGKYYCCNDIASDPNMALWRKEALKRNYRSSIALPIRVFDSIIGAFTLYVSETNFFNKTEIDLLLQVTSDISFALEVTETEKKRVAAEKAIKKMNTDLEQSVKLRTQQLEYANKELEAFTYSVSHDLRAPLRNINGWGQVLMEEFKAKLGENGVKYLERVLSETLRMNNLIDDLLKLSRVTIAETKRETVNLTTIAQSIAHRLLDKPINHKTEINIQPDLITIGDSRLLEIALTNLLDNSYKFTGKLSHAVIEFGRSVMDGKIVYWVRDNGVGFDMENSKNLFGVFQRMHNQNEFPGTGVGLATVQRIIHRHDGVIWVDSKINEGTTFYFTIPEENNQII